MVPRRRRPSLAGEGETLASVEVLAADGSGWSPLAPMGAAREQHAAALLPCSKVSPCRGAP